MEQALASTNEQTDSVLKKPLKERLLEYHVRATPEEEAEFFKNHEHKAEVKGNKIYLNESRMSSQEEIDDMFFMETFHNLDIVDPEIYDKLFTASENDPSMQAWKERSYKYVTEKNGEERDIEKWWKESYFDQLLQGYVLGGENSNIPTLRDNFSQGTKDTRFGTVFKEQADNFYKLLGFETGEDIMGLATEKDIMKVATGGIPIPGVAEGDGLKNPSIVSPEDAKTKAAAADIKKKISGVAKKPQQGNTNIQTAMLLEPEKLLEKYKKPTAPPPNVLAANEGAMPVVEEDTQEQSTRQQRRSEIINQLDGAGLSVPAIKAIKVGNIDIETGGTFSHTQKQEGGNGYGLFQLDFQKPFYDKYLESQNLEDSIGSQVNYFLDEINKGGTIGPGNAKSIMDVFNDPKTTPKEATIVLVDKFFKPGKPHVERRIASAMQGYDEELEGFKEGGLADNADDTPGATESEVADDIPAMISEGELVVPANVVRYHGLAKYENMRNAALKNLDALEDNGQIRPVDSDGTPIVKDIKEQTDEVMASKGATVARYNEGGSPKITTGGPRVPTTPARRESTIKYDEQTGTGEYNYTPEGIEKFMKKNPDIHHAGMFGKKSYKSYDKDTNEIVIRTDDLDAKMFDPDSKYAPEIVRYSPEEYFSQEQFIDSEYFNPSDYFSQDVVEGSIKGTLTTPEEKDYRITNPNTKITATGPRTTQVIGAGSADAGAFDGVQFGKTRTDVAPPSGPNTVEKILTGVTTLAALDKLFLDGAITDKVLKWGKENIFDPVGRFLGFKPEVLNAGPLAGASMLNGQLMLADGTMDIVTSLSGADSVGRAIADGTVISANSYLQGIPANAEIVTRFADNAAVVVTDFDSGITNAEHYAVFKDANGVTQNGKTNQCTKTSIRIR